ncbi:hypothetical protein SY89_03280 [Halolamina pelagica]|uniref:Uncharacterized protein n=1 Tax=Halolamina pelagica TaxID=699431 RepID=A0A0P7HXE4_9EURY|nr:hypothetical protein [Halolamina pelagica]KPN29046.1 hypothetical protein SY89_03280 [Halolamina pelagica]
MQIECPHCGTRLALPLSARDIQNVLGTNYRLQGGEHECADCENELGVYYY